MAGHRNMSCLLFCLTTGIYRAFMIIYFDSKEYKIELQSILSQKLYNDVTPLLAKLETSKGARKAFEVQLQNKLFTDEYFKGKINFLKGDKVWDDFKDDVRFIELVAETMLNVRNNIFESISIDDETIPVIFDLFRVCIKKSSITNADLLTAINEPSTSDFWQEQDLNEVLEQLKFFRSTVLARIKSST